MKETKAPYFQEGNGVAFKYPFGMIASFESLISRTIIWGAGTFFFLLATSMLKLFHWMQMDKNAVIREIKRLELQVGLLNSKLEVKA